MITMCFTLVWTFAITAILLILEGKMAKIQVFSDGILIDDFMYPAFIPNDAIKSIRLVYKSPSVMMRSNGYGGIKMWKGFYRLKEFKKRAVLYLENHYKGPFVEIQTTNDLFYINFKNAEQTTQLYNEMNSTELVDESRVIDLPKLSQKRSIVVVVVFTLVLMIPILLLPMLF